MIHWNEILFMICLWPFQMLGVVGTRDLFKFHPRCRKMKLNHLCFADDLMLFSKGDPYLISPLYQCLDSFSKTSGLSANKSKSALFLAGLSRLTKERIAESISLPLGSFPVKYLGVPLNFKRQSAADFDVIIDKMTAHLRLWYYKNLSYAGRLQLVTSVLMGITSYWCQIFVLLKCVIRKINSI